MMFPNILLKMQQFRIWLIIKIFRHLSIKSRKIVFFTPKLRQYNCNPKYLTEHLCKRNDLDIVWIFENVFEVREIVPLKVRIIKYFSIKYLYEIYTAKYIITNARIGKGMLFEKRKDQIYIQLWHSSLRLKAIEKDAEETLPQSYIDQAIKDSSMCDYIISGCDFSTNIFKNSFWYKGEILNFGTPRIDFLINNDNYNEIKEKVCSYLKVPISTHIILYAPTFRNDSSYNYMLTTSEEIINAAKQKHGGEWILLTRLHPNLITRIKISDNKYDVTKYQDMQELLIASDILITDYSSCMFDFAFIKKHCILYVPDLNSYLKNERKLYFNLTDLPFNIANSEDEIIQIIKNYNMDDYYSKLNLFFSNIGSYEDGNACKRIESYFFN